MESQRKIFLHDPSDRSSLISYADGMIVSLHTVCSPTHPPPHHDHSGGHTHRRPLTETAALSRKLRGARTHRRRGRGWMTLCECARVTSRLSTTSAQLCTPMNARTHGRRLGCIIPPSSFLSCTPPGGNRCITTICHPLVGMNHLSIIT